MAANLATLGGMSTDKALPPDQTENVRAVLRKIVDEDFGGVILRASEKLGLSRSLIKEILDGGRGAGNKTLTALSEHTGRTRDDILNGVERDPAPREGDRLGDHHDFKPRMAELQVKLDRRGVKPDPEIIGEMRDWSGSRALPRLSVEFLLRVYEALQQAHEDNWDDPEMHS